MTADSTAAGPTGQRHQTRTRPQDKGGGRTKTGKRARHTNPTDRPAPTQREDTSNMTAEALCSAVS